MSNRPYAREYSCQANVPIDGNVVLLDLTSHFSDKEVDAAVDDAAKQDEQTA